MSRGVPNTTQSVPANEGRSAAYPGDDQITALMEGLPEEQAQIRTDRLAGEPPAAPSPPGLMDIAEGKALLVNLRYTNEVIFVPETVLNRDGSTSREFVGQKRLEFIDGHLYCSRSQADFILSICPYVKEEPSEGSVETFTQTGFQTRSASIMAEYATRWADNQ